MAVPGLRAGKLKFAGKAACGSTAKSTGPRSARAVKSRCLVGHVGGGFRVISHYVGIVGGKKSVIGTKRRSVPLE